MKGETKPTWAEIKWLASEASVSIATAQKWYREGGANMFDSTRLRIVEALKRKATTRGRAHT